MFDKPTNIKSKNLIKILKNIKINDKIKICKVNKSIKRKTKEQCKNDEGQNRWESIHRQFQKKCEKAFISDIKIK